jgi:hypothetical protein
MERYPKRFLQASVIYLTVGTLLGVMLGVFPKAAAVFRFLHIHIQLFGFLSMMVFGVAYHVLPRFNGIPLRKPCLMRLHFYLANAGLLGMGSVHSVKIWFPSPWLTAAFIAAALVAATSMFVFVFNLWPVLFGKDAAMPGCGQTQDAPSCPPAPERAGQGGGVRGDQSVASIAAANPKAMAVLARFGIDMCCGGHHTLAQVCAKKKLGLAAVLRAFDGESG